MKSRKFLIGIIGLLIIISAILVLNTRQKKNIKLESIKYEQKTIEGLQPKADLQAKIDEFINEGPDFLDKTIYKTNDEIIKKLGNPMNIKETKVKNIHDPEVIDTVYELFYDGLYIKNYTAIAKDKGWIEHISITKNNYNLKYGINIGNDRNHIESILGKPPETKDDVWIYTDSDGYADTVKFYFKNDTVTKIEWDFWID
jgi:hypothetical protein